MCPLTDPSDFDLVEQTLSGDAEAFGLLVRRHQDRLYHGLVHLCGSSEDALDVAQDAFVQAYTKLSAFRGHSAFYTWLYRIAFNLSMTRRRRARPQTSLDARRAEGFEAVDAQADPTLGLVQQDRAAQVNAALASLSEEHRQVLVLREIEECDYETIAGLLDVPLGTVRSRLHRARLELKERLREVVEEDVA